MVIHTRVKEEDALDIINSYIHDKPKVITLGYLSRYIYNKYDSPYNFYMLGSMGLAYSIGAGLALVLGGKSDVYVIDGDGSLLMNLGSMSTINHITSLKYILIDNECHNSAGKHYTGSSRIDFCEIASSFGFERVKEVTSIEGLNKAMGGIREDRSNEFIRLKVSPMTTKVNRVSLTVKQIEERFRESIRKTHEGAV